MPERNTFPWVRIGNSIKHLDCIAVSFHNTNQWFSFQTILLQFWFGYKWQVCKHNINQFFIYRFLEHCIMLCIMVGGPQWPLWMWQVCECFILWVHGFHQIKLQIVQLWMLGVCNFWPNYATQFSINFENSCAPLAHIPNDFGCT